jgi:hypothetical protein
VCQNLNTAGHLPHSPSRHGTLSDKAQQTFYAAEILYICVITMVKVSILLFYVRPTISRLANRIDSVQMRVFPGKWFKIANLIVLATVISSGASIILAIILQCSPISQLLPSCNIEVLTRSRRRGLGSND